MPVAKLIKNVNMLKKTIRESTLDEALFQDKAIGLLS